MSKATFTPGEWRVGDETGANGVYASDGMLIANTHGYTRGGRDLAKLRAEQDANARLIAAAPRMLAALKEAEALFRWYGDLHASKVDGTGKARRNYDMADACRAAIALAEKETGE
jgi:hypothetical protein